MDGGNPSAGKSKKNFNERPINASDERLEPDIGISNQIIDPPETVFKPTPENHELEKADREK